MIEILKKKPTFANELTVQKFVTGHKAILDELVVAAQIQMKASKRRGSLMDGGKKLFLTMTKKQGAADTKISVDAKDALAA